jgi:hypothetical protein
MHALVRFSHITAGNTFTTAELHARLSAALGGSPDDYRLSSLRYELSKLRAKRVVEKLPRSRRYRLLPESYRICLVFLKLFGRIYALASDNTTPASSGAAEVANGFHMGTPTALWATDESSRSKSARLCMFHDGWRSGGGPRTRCIWGAGVEPEGGRV